MTADTYKERAEKIKHENIGQHERRTNKVQDSSKHKPLAQLGAQGSSAGRFEELLINLAPTVEDEVNDGEVKVPLQRPRIKVAAPDKGYRQVEV